MRTGAIFARGSCRALKWMALLGVVFALGAGSAAAQTLTLDTTHDGTGGNGLKVVVGDVMEGGVAQITVSMRAIVAPPEDPDNNPDNPEERTITIEAAAAPFQSNDPQIDDEDAYVPAKLAETTDFAFNPADPEVDLVFPKDTKGENVIITGTFMLQTNTDPDAEDEDVRLTFTIVENIGALTIAGEGIYRATIDDRDDQDYVLALAADAEPTEGGTAANFEVILKADPAHVNGSESVYAASQRWEVLARPDCRRRDRCPGRQ